MRPAGAESTLVRVRVVSLPAARAGGIERAIDELVPGGKWHISGRSSAASAYRQQEGKTIGGPGEVGEEIGKKQASDDRLSRT
jgi:hypothetical protein